MVPVVWRRQCGCTGQVILALRPAVSIILLMANRVKASPRLTGEDVRPLRLLLSVQPLKAGGLVTFEVVGPIDAALEAQLFGLQ
jgi:hypothetical protein